MAWLQSKQIRLRDYNVERCDRKFAGKMGQPEDKKSGFDWLTIFFLFSACFVFASKFPIVLIGRRFFFYFRVAPFRFCQQISDHFDWSTMRTREERQTHAQRRPDAGPTQAQQGQSKFSLIIHSLGNCRQSQTSSDSSWRSVNSSSDKLKSASTYSCQCCLHWQLLVRLTKSCQNKQH